MSRLTDNSERELRTGRAGHVGRPHDVCGSVRTLQRVYRYRRCLLVHKDLALAVRNQRLAVPLPGDIGTREPTEGDLGLPLG